jgi:hypothetical protein
LEIPGFDPGRYATPDPVLDRTAAAGFRRVQFHSELRNPLPQFKQEPLRIFPMLKPAYEVIGKRTTIR